MIMSSTDFLFAQSAIERIGQLEEHFTLRRANVTISRCGGCGGPAYQQPCAICNFYPMGEDKGHYSPKVATFDHFKFAIERSAPSGMRSNLATWYFKTRFERVAVMKDQVPEMIAKASQLDNMPMADIVWRIVVDEERSLSRERPPLHIQYGWDAVDGLNHLRTHRQMDTKLSGRIGQAVEAWVQAAHGDDLDATVSALDEVGLLLRNHTAHIMNGNRLAALKASDQAVDNLPHAPNPLI
jgi:hypothetical protein